MNKFTWEHYILDSELESTTKLVLLAIASHINKLGDCAWPGQTLLAKRCSLSRETVARHCQKAENAGYLRVLRQVDDKGAQTVNKYWWAVPKDVIKDHTPCDPESHPLCSTITPPVTDDHTNRPLNRPLNIERESKGVPPNLDDVIQYFADKGESRAEAEAFHAFYESKGWMVGKNRMVKWKAAASGWMHRRRKEFDKRPAKPMSKGQRLMEAFK